MYSPKISEDLVPLLFKVAVSKRIPMTKLVNRIITNYLKRNGMMEGGSKNHESKKQLGGLQRAEANGYHQRDPAPLRPPVVYEAKEG